MISTKNTTSGSLTKVVFNSDEVDSIKSDIETRISNFNDDVLEFEKLLEEIVQAWEGKDAAAYIWALKIGYSKGLKDMRDVLIEYKDYLEAVKNVYDDVDSKYGG